MRLSELCVCSLAAFAAAAAVVVVFVLSADQAHSISQSTSQSTNQPSNQATQQSFIHCASRVFVPTVRCSREFPPPRQKPGGEKERADPHLHTHSHAHTHTHNNNNTRTISLAIFHCRFCPSPFFYFVHRLKKTNAPNRDARFHIASHLSPTNSCFEKVQDTISSRVIIGRERKFKTLGYKSLIP